MSKKTIQSALAALLCTGIMTGCGEAVQTWLPVSGNRIVIAVAGDDEFYNENGVPEALELAAADFQSSTGTTVEFRYFDDDADYHKAITMAQEIASDHTISAVLSKQETDFADTLIDIYEKAEKPFILMSGCYDHTIEKGYNYLLNDSICASDAGKIMGSYVVKNGFKRAVFCHSDTEYEEDELKGFQSIISDSDTVLAGTVVGPYTQEDFDIAYAEWQLLNVDAVCVSNYYILNSDLVRMLRQKGSDIQVISDYIMDTEEDIGANADYLDGTVIVPLYMLSDSDTHNSDTAKRYEEKYGFEMNELAVQAYDLVKMTAETLNSGVSTANDFMNAVKSPEGYEGLCGTVKFDKNGSLIPENDGVLIFRDGMFRPVSEVE